MDKATAKAIGQDVEAALESVWAKHGLQQSKRSARYGDGVIRFTIEAQATGLDSPLVKDWQRYAVLYGLPVDALGGVVRMNGRVVTITGLVTSRRKYPVHTTDRDGKVMLYTVEGINNALARA